eukprot:753465-Hanusia_phi.AAC.1
MFVLEFLMFRMKQEVLTANELKYWPPGSSWRLVVEKRGSFSFTRTCENVKGSRADDQIWDNISLSAIFRTNTNELLYMNISKLRPRRGRASLQLRTFHLPYWLALSLSLLVSILSFFSPPPPPSLPPRPPLPPSSSPPASPTTIAGLPEPRNRPRNFENAPTIFKLSAFRTF